uniref:RUN domain-containing protein n=1 Tax=Soboliphyme baturini TaxID=241478 RepID=A0A183J9D2_9BILA
LFCADVSRNESRLSSVDASRHQRIQKVFSNVRLLVRVLRQWPRSQFSADNIDIDLVLKGSSDLSGDSLSTEVEELGELPSSSATATTGTSIGSGARYGYSSATMFRHKRRLPQRRPTFDEREEHMLEMADLLNSQDQSARSDRLCDGTSEEQVPKVDSRIREQIEEFDKSFISNDELEAGEISSQTAKSEESSFAAETRESSPLKEFSSVKSAVVKVMLHSRTQGRSATVVADWKTSTQSTDAIKRGMPAPSPESFVKPTPLIRKENRFQMDRKDETSTPPAQVHFSETTIYQRCPQCNATLELFDEDTISLSVICLSTFVNRDPVMAAPCLLRILTAVAKIAHHFYHPWQADSSIFVPGNCRSVARQFLRVILHQLTPNHLFLPLFQSEVNDPSFFKTIAKSLVDFQELNPLIAAQYLLQDITDRPCENFD